MTIKLPPPPSWAPIIVKAGSGSASLAPDETFNPVWLDFFIRLEQALVQGAGAVTSVDVAVPSFLSSGGGPVTSAGVITITLQNQNANLVFAGPGSGAAAAPTFRALVALDLPAGARPAYTTLPSAIVVGASPFVYQNPSAVSNADVIVSGGTVTDISFSRDNVTYYTTGLIAGMVRLSPSDYVKLTYAVLPTATLVPR